jgi:hypothetical protein
MVVGGGDILKMKCYENYSNVLEFDNIVVKSIFTIRP